MTLTQLRYFLAVAERGHFTRAAAYLGVAQPALSRQVGALERELSARLFRRTPRGCALSEVGERFYEQVKTSLQALDAGVDAVKQLSAPRLRFGFPDHATYSYLPALLEALEERLPGLMVEQQELFTEQAAWALREGQLDAAILRADVDSQDLIVLPGWREDIMLMLPETHPLAAQPTVPLASLANERLFLFSPRFNAGYSRYIVRCCQDAGFEPRIIPYEHLSFVSLVRRVASEEGVLTVVASLGRTKQEGVVFRALTEPTPYIDMALAWRQGIAKPPLQTLAEIFRKVTSLG